MQHDKALHFIAGVLIFAVGHFASVLIGLGLVVLAAIGKEVYDYINRDKHTPDLWDAVYTIAGGAVGLVCWVRL
jgi:hypothetical protein